MELCVWRTNQRLMRGTRTSFETSNDLIERGINLNYYGYVSCGAYLECYTCIWGKHEATLLVMVGGSWAFPFPIREFNNLFLICVGYLPLYKKTLCLYLVRKTLFFFSNYLIDILVCSLFTKFIQWLCVY